MYKHYILPRNSQNEYIRICHIFWLKTVNVFTIETKLSAIMKTPERKWNDGTNLSGLHINMNIRNLTHDVGENFPHHWRIWNFLSNSYDFIQYLGHIYYKTALESPGMIPGTLTDVYLRLAGTFDHSSVFYFYLLFLVGQWLRCLGPTPMARVQSPEESVSFFFFYIHLSLS